MKKRNILKSKTFLYLTEFFSGMSVMAVELGASRLLAPYFSSSQIVWTIIIGTIMIAMALGNVWGGRSADKNPDPDRLYRRILFAGIWIACIPLVGTFVIAGISVVMAVFVRQQFLIFAAFAACLCLFVFPLLLLGTVTPSLAKYTMDNLEDNGRTVGTLNALNTIGSIIGTFTPTFITIPAVGTAITFLIFAGILLALCVVYFLSAGVKKGLCLLTALVFAFSCAAAPRVRLAFWQDGVLSESESIYNYLQVRETDRAVILSTNVMAGVQSVKMKEGGLTGMYYDYALAAPLMTGAAADAPLDLLILGMGTGTYATQCARYFPQIQTEGVEIDQQITDLAHEYFDLSADIPVTTYDGRAFLAQTDQRYDVIMIDAYQDITIPFQMSSVEFFEQLKDHLKPSGVIVVNMNMYSEQANSINEYLSDTIASVFPHVYTAEVENNTNCELFASMDVDCAANLTAALSRLPDGELRQMMRTVSAQLTPYASGGRLLTDDKAPVEMLGMKAIDEIIGGELDHYRRIFETDGLGGLIGAFTG
ncbi:fused MFS/spermidine synthase [Agathobaculum sp. NTUH-O15-33]|uniref:spermidine synthase n=1 Tax=Agathobaculum sp. NTUH-O15-33 TaxID=3079302 RepID=UPI002958B07E|nr:fused MFS/spermidine synthase [Agathobaculum sp. NTUH-O15-33]WNX85288.1 fused MFS/spermidine synthase [Agathobaculum sp. NTUH-O15-33]